MEIPLDGFEHVIDEVILERGLSYYENDAIVDLEINADGSFEAIVSGTEEYHVALSVVDNKVTAHNCSCPYDFGPVCKHIVAVILCITEDGNETKSPKQDFPKSKKKESLAQQVQEILKSISYEELIDFVQQITKEDKIVRSNLLSRFGHLNQVQSIEIYKNQIDHILLAIENRNGLIGWEEMSQFSFSMGAFIENAQVNIDKKQYQNAFYISAATLEKMTEAFEFVDDSSGEVGMLVDYSLKYLTELSHNSLPKPLKAEMIEYFLSAFDAELFSGWDWHLGILQIAGELAEDAHDADRILARLKTIENDYNKDRSQVIQLNLIRKFNSENDVALFVEMHISNEKIREEEIANAFKSHNFERATQLSLDGIKQDQKEGAGSVRAWQEWLLKIAQFQGDNERIIHFARLLFINHFNPEQDCFLILKKTVKPKDWNAFLVALITEIEGAKDWRRISLLQRIYIEEENWDSLLQLLMQEPSLSRIKEYEQYLAKSYSANLVELYTLEIVNLLEKNTGRSYYREACRYLRRMKKIGGSSKVEALIALFRNRYARRPALLQELNQV